jgi:phosphate transport system substrate-binding protein
MPVNNPSKLGRVGRALVSLLIVPAACLTLAGCNGGSGPGETSDLEDAAAGAGGEVSNMAGVVKINGSSTVLPISNAVQEQFIKQFPNISVSVDGAGTGNGFKEFYGKSIDICDASRPIKPGELEKCRENGVEFIELPVAYDGLTIVVNPKNDWVETLTIEQLRQMFVGDDAAKKWSDIDPSWPDQQINIYAPGTGSGTYDYFHEVVVGDSDGELRGDMNLNEDDNILVTGVAGNEYSIGFFGVAYYEESKDELKAVKIVNPEDGQAYYPNSDTIASGQYAPFSRPLFIYVSTASLGRAEVQTFVNYYLENVPELCEQVGYVRLPPSLLDRSKENLDSEVTGTHYVTTEGEHRSGALADIFVPENLNQ